MHRGFILTAALMGAFCVGIGAFGAHALKQLVPTDSLNTFETGVRYQFYHVLAILAVAILYSNGKQNYLKLAGSFFIAGILLFSGSLYWLTFLKATNSVGLKGVGIITPFGGVFFIAGWLMVFLAFLKKP